MMKTSAILTKEDAKILHKIGFVPLHPLVYKKFNENGGSLDVSIMNKSIDDAMSWLYEDVILNPEIINSPITPPIDIKTIADWIEGSPHKYFDSIGGYATKDSEEFPLGSLHFQENGIRIGYNSSTAIDSDKTILTKTFLERGGIERIMREEALESYGIKDEGIMFGIPGIWYQKDCSRIEKQFGRNFAINYTNNLLEENN